MRSRPKLKNATIPNEVLTNRIGHLNCLRIGGRLHFEAENNLCC